MRQDFDKLSDDELRNSLDVATVALANRLWPRVTQAAPDLKGSYLEFYDFCKLRLAEKHGLTHLLETEGAA